MDKYKVCPNCGEYNNPVFMECRNCQTDLTAVNVGEEALECDVYGYQAETPMIKLCECGAENQVASRKCICCGEDISDIIPKEKLEQCSTQYILYEFSGEYSFDVPLNGEFIVGRENVLKEHLNKKVYVSRSHAKLWFDSGNLYIINLSNTNYTYVNNEKISNDSATLLKVNDEIGLGGCVTNGERQEFAAYLIVREK